MTTRITHLPINHIFVFGSNLAGIHGAGAARDAVKYFKAVFGLPIGYQGQSYAIPTKDYELKTLPLERIKEYVQQFLQSAKRHDNLTLHLTPIGCGLAGYTPEDIAPMFEDAPENVLLPDEFKAVLFAAS